MKIGCLQFSPQVGDVDNNLNRADSVLSRADPMELENLDLLVLPEMAFSGYNFRDLEHIQPYLEHCGSGLSSLWARTMALKYDCTVAVGYPEKMDVFKDWIVTTERYNSLFVVNGDGEMVANYRKSHLYYTDDTWASEGCGYYRGSIPGLGQTAMGICMDINPYKFEAPWHAYEFAFHILEIKANLVIVSMAWLTFEDQREFSCLLEEPDMKTLTYWIQRLEPLIRSDSDDEIIVVFCNRCGTEDEVQYTGTSAVVGIAHGEVCVYGLLGRGAKELLVADTDMPPFAKLVSRTSPVAADMEEEAEMAMTNAAEMAVAESPILPQSFTGESSWALPRAPPLVSKQVPEGKEVSNPPSRRPRRPTVSIPTQSFLESDTVPKTAPISAGRTPIVPTPEAPTPTPAAIRPRLTLATGPDVVQPIAPSSSILPSWTGHVPFTPPMSPSGRHSRSNSRSDWPPSTAIADTPQESMWGSSGPSSALDRHSPNAVAGRRDFRQSSSSRGDLYRSRTVSTASASNSSRGVVFDKPPARRPSSSTSRRREPFTVPASATADFRGRDRRPPWDVSPLERPSSPKRYMERCRIQSPQGPIPTPGSATSECSHCHPSITIAASPSIYENRLASNETPSTVSSVHMTTACDARGLISGAAEPCKPVPPRRSASVSVPATRSPGAVPRRSMSKGPRSMTRQLSRGPPPASNSAFAAFQNLFVAEAEALAAVAFGAGKGYSPLGSRCHSASPGRHRSPGSVSRFDVCSPLTV